MADRRVVGAEWRERRREVAARVGDERRAGARHRAVAGRISPLALGYLLVLHVGFAALLWRSDTADRLRLERDPPPPYLTPHRANMLAFHLRGDAALPAGGWRLFGDSLVQGLPAAALAVRASNYGIGQDDTAGLAARLPLYASVRRADGVLLVVGVNDMKRAENEAILARYAALVDALPSGPALFCHGVLPIDEAVREHWQTRSNARIRAFNVSLRTLCETRGHRYVAPPPDLVDAGGNLRAELHEGDGLHLGADGYAVWVEHLNRELSRHRLSSRDAPGR